MYLQGKVSVVGYSYDAKGGVVAGLNFKGAFTMEPKTGPDIKAKLIRDEAYVYAYYTKVGSGKTSKTYKKVLYNKLDPIPGMQWDLL